MVNELVEIQKDQVRAAVPRPSSGGGRFVMPASDWNRIVDLAKMIIGTDFCPKSVKKMEDAVLAIQYGWEIGFSPMQSLRRIFVVNGKPSLEAKDMMGLVRRSGKGKFEVSFNKENTACTVKGIRRDTDETFTFTYTLEQAKKSGLFDKKDSMWKVYPENMLLWHPCRVVCHQLFSDVLIGMDMVGEANGQIIELDDTEYSVEEVGGKTEEAIPLGAIALEQREQRKDDAREEAKKAIEEKRKAMAAAKTKPMVVAPVAPEVVDGELVDPSGEVISTHVEETVAIPAMFIPADKPAVVTPIVDPNGPITDAQLNALRDLKTTTGYDTKSWQAMLLKEYKVSTAKNLTFGQTEGLIADLTAKSAF